MSLWRRALYFTWSLMISFRLFRSSVFIFWISSYLALILSILDSLIFADFLILASVSTPKFFFLANSSSRYTPWLTILFRASEHSTFVLLSILLISSYSSFFMIFRNSARRPYMSLLWFGFLIWTFKDVLWLIILLLLFYQHNILIS